MSYDVILVLAGGLDESGQPYEWVKRRLDDAIQFYLRHPVPIICLGGGTYHKPPIVNANGFVIHESSASTNYLKEIGNIDSKNIYKEWSSYDTVGNVYFSMVEHINIIGAKNILVITSEFHMDRVKLLFHWIYSLREIDSDINSDIKLFFHASSDKNLEHILHHRIQREKTSIHHIENNLIPRIQTLRDFHRWLYTEHNAYSSHDNNIEYVTDKQILKTY